jgi:hypothetical protein
VVLPQAIGEIVRYIGSIRDKSDACRMFDSEYLTSENFIKRMPILRNRACLFFAELVTVILFIIRPPANLPVHWRPRHGGGCKTLNVSQTL